MELKRAMNKSPPNVSKKKRVKSNNYDILFHVKCLNKTSTCNSSRGVTLINKRTTLENPKAMCDFHRDTCLISIMGWLSSDGPQILVPVDFFFFLITTTRFRVVELQT